MTHPLCLLIIAALLPPDGSPASGLTQETQVRLVEAISRAVFLENQKDTSISIVGVEGGPISGEISLDVAQLQRPARASAESTLRICLNRLEAGDVRHNPPCVFFKASHVTVGVFLRRPVRAGDPVRPMDVETRKLEISPFERNPALSAEQAIGQHLRRSLSSGAMLRGSDLAPEFSVRKGQRVRARYNSTGLTLEFQAKAVSDSRQGAETVLENPFRKGVLRGEVVGPGFVSILTSRARGQKRQ